MDESSGNAADSIGSNTATNVATATFGAAKINNGATLNGSSQYFTFATTPATGANVFSVSAWIKATSLAADGCVVGWGTAGTNQGITMDIRSSKLYADFYGSTSIAGVTTLSTGVYYFVTYTFDGTNIRLYLNGVLEATSAGCSAGIVAANCTIGRAFWVGGNYFNGQIDEVGIWTKVLTQDEAARLYNAGRGNQYPFVENLLTSGVAYYKLDESSGNAADSIGSRTLTNTGTSTYGAAKINNGADFGTSNTTKWLNTSTDNYGIDGSSITIAGWININTQISSGFHTLFGQGSTASFTGQYVEYDYNGGTRRLLFYREKGAVGVDGPTYNTTLTAGTWYHIAYTYDGTNVRGYINGSLVAGPTAASGNGSSVMTNGFGICDRFYSGAALGNKTDMKADEVGIWSRALSASEITSLYNSGNGIQYPFGTAYSLVMAAGSYTYTGVSALFRVALTMIMSPGSYTYTGIAALFKRGFGIVAETGVYVLTGMDATFRTSAWSSLVIKAVTTMSSSVTKATSIWTNRNKNSS